MARYKFWEPVLAGGTRDHVLDVIDRNFLNEGPITATLEEEAARFLGVRHAVATTSGTTALFLALAACGIGPGDEVIVPDVTYVATANAVRLAGAEPRLVDIDPQTLCLDADRLEAALSDRTRAIMPVHVSGRGAAMERIVAFAGRHGLRVIEDAAEALGSTYRGRSLGTWGDVGCFSFSPNKTVSCGQGGMMVTNDDHLQLRLRQLKMQGRAERGTGGQDDHPTLGFNFKLTDLQAAVALPQLRDLPARLDRQRRTYEIYAEVLGNAPGIRILPFDTAAGETPQWTDALVDNRDGLADHLASRGIGHRKFWYPVHRLTPYRLPDDEFLHSTAMSPLALWLPSALDLTDDDVRHVALVIRDWLVANQVGGGDAGLKADQGAGPWPRAI